jgi:hypothetical protein
MDERKKKETVSFPFSVGESDLNPSYHSNYKVKTETGGSVVGPGHPMFSFMNPSNKIPLARVDLTEPVFGPHTFIDRTTDDNRSLLEKGKKK